MEKDSPIPVLPLMLYVQWNLSKPYTLGPSCSFRYSEVSFTEELSSLLSEIAVAISM